MAMPLKDIVGQRFGKRTALKHVGNGYWLMRCDCGVEGVACGTQLRLGRSQSCLPCAPKRQPIYRSAEERRAARRENVRKYVTSSKGRAQYEGFLTSEARLRYIHSEQYRKLKRQRNRTESYKIKRRTYRKLPHVRAKEMQYKRDLRQRIGMTNAERARARRYMKSPKGHVVRQRRRAMVRELLADLTTAQWQQLKLSWGGCAFCNKSDVPLTMEHVVAVVNGGGTTLANIVPACKSCNCRKQKSMLKDFANRSGLALERFLERQRAIVLHISGVQEAA